MTSCSSWSKRVPDLNNLGCSRPPLQPVTADIGLSERYAGVVGRNFQMAQDLKTPLFEFPFEAFEQIDVLKNTPAQSDPLKPRLDARLFGYPGEQGHEAVVKSGGNDTRRAARA